MLFICLFLLLKPPIRPIVGYTKNYRLGDATVGACTAAEKAALTATVVTVEIAQKAFAALTRGRNSLFK